MAPWNAAKERLYIVLLHRGGRPDAPMTASSYRWAIIIGSRPQIEQPRRGEVCTSRLFTIKRRASGGVGWWWSYEEHNADEDSNDILARVMFAKIADRGAFERILSSMDIKYWDTKWTSYDWAKDVVERLYSSGAALSNNFGGWESIERKCVDLVEMKMEAGRYEAKTDGEQSRDGIPTWDLEQDEETVP